MLLQNDPFRDIDAWFDRMTGRSAGNGQWPMPMDAYKRGNDLWVDIDLPGVDADSVEINVERNVLTVSAQRSGERNEGDQVYLAERHRGNFRRQVHLGDGLDRGAHRGPLQRRSAHTAHPCRRRGAAEEDPGDHRLRRPGDRYLVHCGRLVQLRAATRRVAERTSVGSGGGSHGAVERRP